MIYCYLKVCQHDLGIIRNIPWYRFDGVLLTRIILIFDRGHDRIVVGFTTTYAISPRLSMRDLYIVASYLHKDYKG
jgi:hypothetical protein